MSIRAVSRFFKHGTYLLRNFIYRKDFKFIISDKINAVSQVPVASQQGFHAQNRLIPRNFVFRNVGHQIGIQARRILIDNVLNRVTNSLAGDLRKRAAKRILYGDSAPFFALVGVSLASGTGIITKEEELEGVCWEIREAISKMKWNYHDINIDEVQSEDNPITLKDLSIGKHIAKGSNAVVYAAKLKDHISQEQCDTHEGGKIDEQHEEGKDEFPFALKMMFNYDIQSSSMAILKAMYRETVPARMYYSQGEDWELDLANRKRHLPPHPNVVAIFSVFTDSIPELESCRSLFPDALPPRIYSDGSGRNMSLFLLMKRYNTSLEKYLANHELTTRTSILLFAQLLEGVAHLTAHKIAHRDLKADNLLIDSTEEDAPILVISDFGCCLADRSNGLLLSYTSSEIDKGGNAALMAPEIYLQKPGTFCVLNYSKSDLWAAGAIAYEIFGMGNPFYGRTDQVNLRNATYREEDLPQLPERLPVIIRMLVQNILCRNPNKRLEPEVAANVAQLFLWAPSSWLRQSRKLPSSAEILQWLLSLTTKILCERRVIPNFVDQQITEGVKRGRRTYPEYLLISSFLCRASLSNIRLALYWIQNDAFERNC